jgi:hypothetical protein
MQKGLGGLGTLLVLGLGMGLLRVGGPTSGGGSSAKPGIYSQQPAESQRFNLPAKCSLPDCVEKDLLDTIGASSSPPAAAADDGVNNFVTEFQKAISGNEVKFAIAIVPDPVHTHLSLFFDRTMDAIQQGAQQAGWMFDRATMPWDSQEHPESTDFHVRLGQEEYQDNKEVLPGLMIFRHAHPRILNTPLYVFVVGETPTGGVNKDQFRTALELIAKPAKAGAGPPEEFLRIIGPTFSGSLYSLAQLINELLPKAQFSGIVIRSGTVSSWGTTQWFKQQFERTPQVDFATFQESNQFMLRKFIEFEKGRGYAPGKIAILTEDETAYGNIRTADSAKASVAASQTSSCPDGSQARDASSSADEANLQEDENCILHLHFPRDISQLRSAYQQGFQSKAAASSEDSYQVRSTLPINLQDTGSDDDSVQRYAHSETPLSQESILLGIVAAIRERDIQFVVLQATNPMDTVFLSAFLKKSDSAARVVAMPADLLLSRDADDVSLLHGVMALTTYSLLPGLADETAVPISLKTNAHAEHIFPNAFAAGTYNATLSQIACIESPSEAGCVNPSDGLPVARYAEYGWPSLGGPREPTEPLAPVVWLTVLGRGGFWPVAILDKGGNKEGKIESSPRPIYVVAHPCAGQYPGHPECCIQKAEEFNPTRRTFSALASGFALMLVAAYLWLLRKGSIFASTSTMAILAPIEDECRSRLIMVIGWLLLAGLLLLAWPWVVWWGLGPVPEVCVIVAAIFIVLLCGICTRELYLRESLLAALVFFVVALGLVAGFVVLYAVRAHSQNPFLYRYIHITSGVSPLLPFLCLLAAGLWWAWCALSGLAFVDKRRPKLPCDHDLPGFRPSDHIGPSVMRGFWPTEKSVEKLLYVVKPCAWDSRIYLPIFMLLAISLCALDYGHPLLSLETRHFEWVYVVSLAVIAVALLGTLFRLLVIWLECRKILTTLDRFPLRRAFGELHFSWDPIWRLGGDLGLELSRLVARQLETLEQLRLKAEPEKANEGAGRLLNEIERSIAARNEMRRNLEEYVRARGSDSQLEPLASKQPDPSDYFITKCQPLQEMIAKTCAEALKYLQPKWWGKEGLMLREVGSKDDGEKSITVVCCKGEKDDEEEKEPSLSTRLAERFVALVYLNFILVVLLRMRTLGIAVAGLYVFLLLSVDSYPFEPRTALRSAAILLLMFIVGIVGYVCGQAHRDSILSLVTQTKPGELGMQFWLRMGTLFALPLISLLVSQFPSLNNALFSWLEPAVNALK